MRLTKKQAMALAAFLADQQQVDIATFAEDHGEVVYVLAEEGGREEFYDSLRLYEDGTIRASIHWGSFDYWDAWLVEPDGSAYYVGSVPDGEDRVPPQCIMAVAEKWPDEGEGEI